MKYFLPLVMLAILIMVGGCHSSGQTASCENCSIRVFSGGGFSGLQSGYDFKSNGMVMQWRRMPGDKQDSITARHQVCADSLDFLFRYLNEINFSSVNYSGKGNMNYSIEWRNGGGELHAVSWGDSDPSAPAEAKVFYKIASNFGARFISKQ